ncbi:MAG TPA: SCO family protein [Steroidobacteraceae bacterium]|nr:SCO family protein [Steroidobacteraceae bacterium]
MNVPRLAVATLSLLVAVAAGAAGAPAFKAGLFDPPRQAPDFSLQGTDGHELRMSRYHGKVVLLAFGYSSCTAVCPVTLATLAAARRELGPAASDVQVLYVTVDPERDDPARLEKFLHAFDATFVGGTGAPAALAAVRKDYGISAQKLVTPDGYSYSHSSFVYLIDRGGRIRALMPYGHSPGDFVNDLRLLLEE